MATSVTIGIEDVATTVAEARERVSAGFRVLKVKLGHDLEQDVERLHRVRETCGSGVGLRVDANQGYSAEETVALVQRTSGLDIELIEQPMAAGSPEPMAALPEEVRRRIAADESLLDEADAHRLSGPPPVCGIFNIKLMKCGGIWPGLGVELVQWPVGAGPG
jgi:L-alanine-DL-glutamate epimerase-like enolase superfamily enzyme